MKSKTFYILLMFLMLFSCIRPQYLNIIPGIKYLYLITIITSVFISIFVYLKNFKFFKFSHVLLLYYVILLIPTLIYNFSVSTLSFYLITYLSVWSVVVFAEFFINKKMLKELLEIIGFISASLTFLNVVFIIVKGANYLGNRSSFLGYDNTVLPFILFGAIITYVSPRIVSNKERGVLKKLSTVNIAAAIINCLIIDSSNAKIAAVMLILLLILDRAKVLSKKSVSKFLNLKTYIIFSIVAFLGIVVFRLQYLFEDIIVNDLNRNLTITGRTSIWDLAIESIKRHPILGVGVEDFKERSSIGGSIFHAHSTYLNIIFEGGILSVVAYLNIFRFLQEKIKNQKTNQTIAFLSFGILIYFTITVIEYYQYAHMFYLLTVITYHIPDSLKLSNGLSVVDDYGKKTQQIAA